MTAFEELGVMPEIIRAVEDMGWLLPTPIQAECIPLILGGGDVMAAAETGSGKTGAFALPLLQVIHEAMVAKTRGKPAGGKGGGGGKAGAPPPVVMNINDRDPMLAIAPDGLVCQSRSETKWCGARATVGAVAGQVYYEARVTDEGLCRVGWSSKAAGLELGTDNQSFGYGGTAKKSHARQFLDYGAVYGKDDVIGCLLNADRGFVAFFKNGVDLGVAFEIPAHLRGQGLYPAICLKNAEVALNFGATPFTFPPPPGFVGLPHAPPHVLVSVDGGAGGPDKGDRHPYAIVLEPARDLAEQTYQFILQYQAHLSDPELRSTLLVGGVDSNPQIKDLKRGVDIVVGTPLKVKDMIDRGLMRVDNVRFFVLDEADRLLDTGNQDVILKMFAQMPKQSEGAQRLQVLMFSATLHSPEIKQLSETLCKFPTWVDLKGKESVPETVHHAVLRVAPTSNAWVNASPPAITDGVHARDPAPMAGTVTSPEAMSEVIKRIKPQLLKLIIDKHKMEQVIIFCRTNVDCDNLERFLNTCGGSKGFMGKAETGKENPYSCVVLAGVRSMEERRRNLAAFKEGDVRLLICTDVAARGLDIKELPFVINMTLPDKSEDYIHRVGRVGRADTMGLAISLVAEEKEKVWYHTCANRGKGCSNTADVAQKGCTIWYDEPQLLKDVEKRLGGEPIAEIGPDLELPNFGGATDGAPAVVYGQQKGGGYSKATAEHLEELKPAIQSLGELEVAAQKSFHALKQRWAKVQKVR
eukprot:jgi/Mesvir1/2406/Mv22148-RA.1